MFKKFNWEYFLKYVQTYIPSKHANNYCDTIIKDMIYGLGVSVSDKYKMNSGYRQFQKDLSTHILDSNDEERILCSAIWYKELPTQNTLPININHGIVLCGFRHGNIISTLKAVANLRTVRYGPDSVGESVQGFLTNKNRFVDRKEAGIIAFKSGQTKKLIKNLHSEDVWLVR